MAQSDSTTGKKNPLQRITIPSGVELYDALMNNIEPDLVTKNIAGLDEKYKGESADERAARLKRYNAAYAAYDLAYAVWLLDTNGKINKYRRAALSQAESEDRQRESQLLQQFEPRFNSPDNL